MQIQPPDSDALALDVRVVRTQAPSGEESYLATSLLEDEFDREKLSALSRLRWKVESFYKIVKSEFIGQGQFRSKDASGVKQEFGALMMFLVTSRFLSFVAAEAEGCSAVSVR